MGNESRKTCKFKVGKRDIGSRSPSGSAGIFLGLSFGNQERQWKILTPNFHHVSYIPSKTKLRWVRGFPMCDYLYPEVPKVSHDSHSTTHVWSFKSHWITQIHRRKFDPRLRIRAIRQDGILPGLVVTVKSQGLKMGFFSLPHLPILIYPLVIQQVARLRTGKWHIEIVDLPFFEMVIFHSHVSLPKGNSCWENDEPSKSEAFP